jgi:hypothetical protein
MVAGVVAVIGASGCQFQHRADAKFGDQNFKTAVALIELYRVRHGVYPAALSELDFTGDWDAIALAAVSYQRLPDGYELNVTRGWVGKPTLEYPDAFWHGLGIKRTNVAHRAPAT